MGILQWGVPAPHKRNIIRLIHVYLCQSDAKQTLGMMRQDSCAHPDEQHVLHRAAGHQVVRCSLPPDCWLALSLKLASLGITPIYANVHHAAVCKAATALTVLQGTGLSALLLPSTLTSQGGTRLHIVWGLCQCGSLTKSYQHCKPRSQSNVSSLACPGQKDPL